MNVKADQLPVYKAIVVIIIVTLQSDVFKKFIANSKAKNPLQQKEVRIMNETEKENDEYGFLLLITIVLFFVMYAAGMVIFADKGFANRRCF